MEQLNLVQNIAVWVLPVLFAITVHEVAHGWVAKQLGDSTAMMLGRLTLNPIKHIDPIGTVLVPFGMLLLTQGQFAFGWAKPVPVNWRNLRRPKRDMGLVALAGPGANLIMATAWALLLQLGLAILEEARWVAVPLVYMSAAGVLVNLILMVLNLLPILPLDGGRVLTALLPARQAQVYSRLEPYGLFIVLALLVSGLLARIMWPVILYLLELFQASSAVITLFLNP
jgi:Zn-dependent protease